MRRRISTWIAGCAVLYWLAAFCSAAFGQQIPTLRTRTNLVLVPTLVESKTGEPVFNLTGKDFLVKDNGVEQAIHLDSESYAQPMSLVVLLQVGRSAVREFYKYRGLATMVEALAGAVPHRIAVVEFDSQPRMLRISLATPTSSSRLFIPFSPETMERPFWTQYGMRWICCKMSLRRTCG